MDTNIGVVFIIALFLQSEQIPIIWHSINSYCSLQIQVDAQV